MNEFGALMWILALTFFSGIAAGGTAVFLWGSKVCPWCGKTIKLKGRYADGG